VAVLCPQTQDLKCSNIFFVKNGQVDFASNIPDLKFFFAAELGPVPSKEAATDAASTWLRFSEELKQDLFYKFSAPEISYMPREDVTMVRGNVAVMAGGEGHIELLMTLGTAGSLVHISEKGALRPGVRPICQATKLLDRDPIVRRMAEQDLLVMGRAAKPYLDQVRATAGPMLQQAIDSIWQRIVGDSDAQSGCEASLRKERILLPPANQLPREGWNLVDCGVNAMSLGVHRSRRECRCEYKAINPVNFGSYVGLRLHIGAKCHNYTARRSLW